MNVDELQKLLDAATPGEWKARKKNSDEDPIYGFDWYHYSDQHGVVGYWTGHKDNHKEERWCLSEADARLIALAPSLARQVIEQQDEIERLRGEYAKLEAIYSTACQIAAAEIKEAAQ
ncbi:hypothetical protein PAF17_15895 [Paracoccus sp. Z330]|uniref:Uncharacterized protein n=1 Tax=Paracoccus onchidii TaxID=3017813 RepID=A0ABT4ZHZ2_9RHOB|nr:hypothetical protein [Paracoccus onchidii]MDB6178974.1 hypothetical protein [Paracoccus onchidii]